MLDEVGEVRADAWLELEVGDTVDSNGIYTFVIATDSADGVNMSSRDGAQQPQLVLSVLPPEGTPTATATVTPTTTPTATAVGADIFASAVAGVSSPADSSATPTPTAASTTEPSPTEESSPTEAPTSTPTPTETPTATATATPVPTPEPLSTIPADAVLFFPAADSRVDEAEPNSNRGTGKQLRVDGDDSLGVETYLVFRVRGLSGAPTNATLRVYSLMDSMEGPAVYAADSNWTESDITWANRPARTSEPLDTVGAVVAESWIEFDVTALISGDGVYTFLLATESTDGLNFSSRESPDNPPFLAITVADSNTLANTTITTPIATWTPPAET
jgi:hypothetical protein